MSEFDAFGTGNMKSYSGERAAISKDPGANNMTGQFIA